MSPLARDRGRDPTPILAWRFACYGITEQLRTIRRRLGLLRLRELSDNPDSLPDSALAKAAYMLAASLSSPMLLNHAVRTYLFGSILAARDGLKVDRELLYVAAVLHDLGLTHAHESEPGSFEWVGARRARTFGIDQGMGSQRADLLHDAIALHSSVGIASAREPEIAMVHYGAGLDLFGARLQEIPGPELEQLLKDWPRCGFKTRFPSCLELQARTHVTSPPH